MNKQKKLEAIYKEIANKELSFGCKILDNSRDTGSNTFYITESVAGGCVLIVSDEADDHCGYEHIGAEKSRKWGDFKIIGHPVMIGDMNGEYVLYTGEYRLSYHSHLPDIKTLTLEEAIDMLPGSLGNGKQLFMGKGIFDKYRVIYTDNEWGIEDIEKYGKSGETLLQAVEKMLLYLHDNNLLGKK